MFDDVVVAIVFLLTIGFGLGVLVESDTVASWCAAGLVLFGIVRLASIISQASRPRS